MECKKIKVRKFANNQSWVADDFLALEEPLEIQLKYKEEEKAKIKIISVTMRTPGHDAELAAGFLFTEGIIKGKADTKNVSLDSSQNSRVIVTLVDNVLPDLQNSDRNFYTSSSCGVCGKTSIDAVKTVSKFTEEPNKILLNPEMICKLPQQLLDHQKMFEATGGLHASALFDLNGKLILLREDVGRHNALDKVIGASLLNDTLPLFQSILLLSGRASFELIQKANMAGIKVVVAIGSPSSLAVQLAVESGITLIGFLRNQNFNIYSCDKRIQLYEPQGA